MIIVFWLLHYTMVYIYTYSIFSSSLEYLLNSVYQLHIDSEIIFTEINPNPQTLECSRRFCSNCLSNRLRSMVYKKIIISNNISKSKFWINYSKKWLHFTIIPKNHQNPQIKMLSFRRIPNSSNRRPKIWWPRDLLQSTKLTSRVHWPLLSIWYFSCCHF